MAGIKEFSEHIAKCLVACNKIVRYVFGRKRWVRVRDISLREMWVHAHAEAMRVSLGKVVDSIKEGMNGIEGHLASVRLHVSQIEIDED